MLFQFFTIGRFYFGFILCVTFVTRWSYFPTVSVELYELMNLWTYVICAVKNYLLTTYVYCLQWCIQQWGFGRTVCPADDFEIVIVFWGISESPSSDVRKHPSVAKVLDLPLTILQSIIEYFDNSISYAFTFTMLN